MFFLIQINLNGQQGCLVLTYSEVSFSDRCQSSINHYFICCQDVVCGKYRIFARENIDV